MPDLIQSACHVITNLLTKLLWCWTEFLWGSPIYRWGILNLGSQTVALELKPVPPESSCFHSAKPPLIRWKLLSLLAPWKALGKSSKDETYYYHYWIPSQLLEECFVQGGLINLCWFDLERALLYPLELLRDIVNEREPLIFQANMICVAAFRLSYLLFTEED